MPFLKYLKYFATAIMKHTKIPQHVFHNVCDIHSTLPFTSMLLCTAFIGHRRAEGMRSTSTIAPTPQIHVVYEMYSQENVLYFVK